MNSPFRSFLALASVSLLSTNASPAKNAPIPAAAPPASEVIDFPQLIPQGTPSVSTIVRLRPVAPVYTPAPAPLLVSAPAGGRVTLLPDLDPALISSITWRKDGQTLNVSTPTLEISAATPAHSGNYSASVIKVGGAGGGFETISLRVATPHRQQLMNLSTRARISPAQPSFISGFVVSPPASATETKLLLVRAVGPTLANYGLADPLADPVIELFDGSGRTVAPLVLVTVYPGPLEDATARVGAFPLPLGTKDFRGLYAVPGGVYSIKVSSASGGTGTVLLELYDASE